VDTVSESDAVPAVYVSIMLTMLSVPRREVAKAAASGGPCVGI